MLTKITTNKIIYFILFVCISEAMTISTKERILPPPSKKKNKKKRNNKKQTIIYYKDTITKSLEIERMKNNRCHFADTTCLPDVTFLYVINLFLINECRLIYFILNGSKLNTNFIRNSQTKKVLLLHFFYEIHFIATVQKSTNRPDAKGG